MNFQSSKWLHHREVLYLLKLGFILTMRSKCQIVRCKPIYSLVKCVLHKIYIIFSIWYQITECLTCCTAEVEIQQLTTLTGVPGLLLGVSLLLIVSSPSTLRTITILTSPLLLTVIIIITYKLLTLLESPLNKISLYRACWIPTLQIK